MKEKDSPREIGVDLHGPEITAIFDSATSQEEYVAKLYRLVFGDAWEDLPGPFDPPKVSKWTGAWIMEKAMAWDRAHEIDFPGGAWMNYGFGVDPDLDGFDWYAKAVLPEESPKEATDE